MTAAFVGSRNKMRKFDFFLVNFLFGYYWKHSVKLKLFGFYHKIGRYNCLFIIKSLVLFRLYSFLWTSSMHRRRFDEVVSRLTRSALSYNVINLEYTNNKVLKTWGLKFFQSWNLLRSKIKYFWIGPMCVCVCMCICYTMCAGGLQDV